MALVGPGDGAFVEMINPELVATQGQAVLSEGCLSMPGIGMQSARHTAPT